MMLERFAGFLIIAIQAFLIADYSGQVLFPMVASGLAFLGIYFRVPLVPVVVVLLTALAGFLFFLQNRMNPPEIAADWIIPGQYVLVVCQTLVTAQLLEFLRLRGESRLAPAFYGLAGAGMLCAFCRWESPRQSLLYFMLAVGFAGLLLVPGGLAAARGIVTRESGGARAREGLAPRKASRTIHGRFSTSLTLLAGITLALGTGYAADTAKRTVGLARFFVQGQVTEIIERNQTRVAFSVNGNFGDINRIKQTAPEQVALFIECDVPPGYLRGRAFTDLANVNTGWREYSARRMVNGGRRLLEPIPPGNMDALREANRSIVSAESNDVNAFAISNAEDVELRRVIVRSSPNHVGKCFFIPANSSIVEAQADSLVVNRHGIVVEGPADDATYFSHTPRSNEPQALPESLRRSCLQLSNQLDPRVFELAREVCQNSATDRERIAAIENHFRAGYEYSLDKFSARSGDRLSYFILNRPPSYCEYFASAAVMFLRANGIPARYATGFATVEPSTSDANDGEMWVARNMDAHAWAEAYDRQTQQWVVVEATPGADYPKKLWKDAADASGGGGTTTESVEVEEENLQLNWWKQQWLNLRGFLIRNDWLPNLFGGLVLFLAVAWYLARRLRGGENQYGLRGEAAVLRKLDRQLRKKKLVRRPGETLHQFAGRIESLAQPETDWLAVAADRYREYAQLRYLPKNVP